MAKKVTITQMAQSKDLKPAEGTEEVSYRFPNWLLFLISALAIFFSPLGILGLSVIGFYTVASNSLFSWLVEPILFLVGIYPVMVLGTRREYALVAPLIFFGILNFGAYCFVYWITSFPPTLGG